MSKIQELPHRKDVKVEDTWDLTPIFKSDSHWEEEFKAVSNKLEKVVELKGTLTKSADDLLKGLKFKDDLQYRLEHLYVYAHLSFDTDTTNSFYQAMNGKIMGLLARFGAEFSFFDTEILSAGEDLIRGYIEENEGLELYEHQFEILFKNRPHILSEKEEES